LLPTLPDGNLPPVKETCSCDNYILGQNQASQDLFTDLSEGIQSCQPSWFYQDSTDFVWSVLMSWIL
jgi:hypothetical protein